MASAVESSAMCVVVWPIDEAAEKAGERFLVSVRGSDTLAQLRRTIATHPCACGSLPEARQKLVLPDGRALVDGRPLAEQGLEDLATLQLTLDAAPAGAGAAGGGGKEGEDEEECSVCLETFSDVMPSVTTGCGHHFHGPCIAEWRKRSEFCPLCRRHLGAAGDAAGGAGSAKPAYPDQVPLSIEEAARALAATRDAIMASDWFHKAKLALDHARTHVAPKVWSGLKMMRKVGAEFAKGFKEEWEAAKDEAARAREDSRRATEAASRAATPTVACPTCGLLLLQPPGADVFKCSRCQTAMRVGGKK